MPPFVNLVGQRFARLLVLKQLPDRTVRGKILWLCLCDCGNETKTISADIKRGKKRSCGCLKRETSIAFIKARINPDSSFRRLYLNYQFNAAKQKRDFALSREDFRRLTSAACHYCGRRPSSVQVCGETGRYVYNGIDRRDSSLGYVLENCVACCWTCNQMKSTFAEGAFLKGVDAIYLHQHRGEQ